MHRGYVKVWRKLGDSGILKDPLACQFFLWAMLKATHKHKKQPVGNQVVDLEPGQFVSGRKAASSELGISQMVFRGVSKKMENMDFITITPTNKFSVYTIINWATYQNVEPANNQQINQQITNNEPTDNQQVTTNKNAKNIKNEKNTSGYSLEFEAAWKVYPKKTNKGAALKAWNAAIKRGLPVDLMPQHIESRMYEPDWRKDDGKYIPHMATWLNADGWLDEGARITTPQAGDDDPCWMVDFWGNPLPKDPEVQS